MIGGFIYYAEVRGRIEEWLREPIISAKHTPEANRAGELDTIFDIRSFWEIYSACYITFTYV